MKICMLIRSMPAHGVGGMEDHTMTLSRTLVQRGHSVDVVTTAHPNEIEKEEIEGIRIHYISHTRSRRYFGGWWRESPPAVFNLHKKVGFDVLHSQSTAAFSVIKRRVHSVLGLPVVISMHGTAIDEIRSKLNVGLPLTRPTQAFRIAASFLKYINMFCRIERFCIPRVDAVIATSKEQYALIRQYYRVRRDRLYIVYNGIDVHHFSPESALMTKTNQGPGQLILVVARLVEDKGIDNIVKAMPIIREQVPAARLKIVGDGRMRPYLERLVDHLRLREYVSFAGYVTYKELPDYYRRCNVFVNPTIRSNGYDLTILQAMACCCPIVVSNIGSIPTVAKHNCNSLLTSPGDVHALANNVIHLLGNESLANRLADAGRKTIEKEFSLEKMASDTESVYCAAMAEHSNTNDKNRILYV